MSAFYHSSGIPGVLLSINCLGGGQGGSWLNKYNIYIIVGMGRMLHACIIPTFTHASSLPAGEPPGSPLPAPGHAYLSVK